MTDQSPDEAAGVTGIDGIEVRERREQLGLSQNQLARLLGVVTPTVSHWEQGRATPPPYLRLALKWIEQERGPAANVSHIEWPMTCECCGTIHERTSPYQRYCPACRPILQREYQREYARRKRAMQE